MKLPRIANEIFAFIGISVVVIITIGSPYIYRNYKATEAAKAFLRANSRFQEDIGEVKEFSWASDAVVKNGSGTVWLKAIGTKKSQDVILSVSQCNDGDYKITRATYQTNSGQTVELVEKKP